MTLSVARNSIIAASPELALAAACALWPPGESRIDAVRKAAVYGIDWPRLLAVSRRHGIVGLVHDGLNRAAIAIPNEAASALAAEAHAIARTSLRLAAEAGRLQGAFEAAGVPVAFVKGPALAQLVYGTLALRPCRDLDLLVPEPQAMAAAALLEREGYRRTDPAPEIGRKLIATWMRSHHDFGYFHDARQIIVELHWRLVENPLLQTIVPQPPTWVVVPIAPRIVLSTLAADDLLVYLTMHGAHHGWARLKWVADVVALLAADPGGADRLLELAEQRGVSRGAWQLLLIAQLLFGTSLPVRVPADKLEGWVVQWLARTALRVITRDGGATGPNDRAFGAMGISVSRLFMKPGWRFKLQQLRCGLVSSDDWTLLKLPPRLQPFYPLLRMPLWLGRRVSLARRHSSRSRKSVTERTRP
jgi:hypothetical protein